jgi:hypothetical protein
VKCDEGRPECLRCITFGTICDGYKVHTVRWSKRELRALVPSCPVDVNAPLLSSPRFSGLHFETETEWQYFSAFRDDVVQSISGSFTSASWDKIVLQACHSEMFVREIVV